MIEQVLRSINNFFIQFTRSVTTIAAGKITVDNPDDFVVGQYVYLDQTLLNNGIYQITKIEGNELTITATIAVAAEAEAENAIVHGLAIPKAVLAIAVEIEAYNTANPNNLVSKTLGDYSVTQATGQSGDASWVAVFGSRLNQWRKVYLTIPNRVKRWI